MSETLKLTTREEVENLKVGDLAPACFGNLAPVVEIYARGVNVHGRANVCYYVQFSDRDARIRDDLVEDELHRTVRLISKYSAAELYAIESRLRKQRRENEAALLAACQLAGTVALA